MIPKILFDICNCSNYNEVINNPECNHCCSEVVNFQKGIGTTNIEDFHIPEPWSGDIVNAPVLFISSNPGYATGELYPLRSWPDQIKADYFINRFKVRGNGHSWVFNSRSLGRNGFQGKSVRYWSSLKKRAEELLDREAIPGKDYCNTEIVHCKSWHETGVFRSVTECANRFVNEIINVSGAKIVVGIGSFVKTHLKGVSELNGKPVVYLPHPNAFEPKTFAKKYSVEELNKIKSLIKAEDTSNKHYPLCDSDMPSDDEVIQFMEKQFSYYL